MSPSHRFQTVVADTSALVSLAVPSASSDYDVTAKPDPLQYLLTACEVSVPPTVKDELRQIAQYQDIHAVAASNVLAAESHYTVMEPYQSTESAESRPTFGLDEGVTDGIVLANQEAVDGFLTDEFGGNNFALVHAALRGPLIVPTPRLLREYAQNEYLSNEEARQLIQTISQHRSWAESPYVTQILDQLSDSEYCG